MARRLARTLIAASLLALAAPVGVFADTEPGTTPVDDYVASASFSFTAEGRTWSGIAQVEDERLSGHRNVSFFFDGSGLSKVCDGGTPGNPSDDYTGTQLIEFFSTSASIKSLAVASDLSSGEFDVALTGREVTLDACTGELIRSRAGKHRFKVDLVARGTPKTGSDVFIVDNGDGTFSRVTQDFAFVTAAGSARIDGAPASVDDANLQHVVLSVEPA